ncbi:uncharacterized protein EKO05_0000460 [Ascochyta rabiei]|uniref:Uncharacterized protein n=1 Tax=Didymella rabiei TaxID=5454 RepID=A0A163J6C2_DIDRA|nr:uncharacterized protein EKO05_0000460 [Ascochyta rabiei]KZM26172.1 hypothetical protein ST47_g2683 [Ascochyta rabiei]UPX09777.1 hypothetical protein EKO05_0000460 [Ascochyta rabiei]
MEVFSSFYAFADRFKRPIYIAQAVLVLGAFITGCTLVANTSMPRSPFTTLVLVYAIKSALFLLYQYLSTHMARFRRFASLKANYILYQLDCLLWFTAFFISCMGGGRCGGSSCTLIAVATTIALLLCGTYLFTAIGINWPKWRASMKLPQVEQV